MNVYIKVLLNEIVAITSDKEVAHNWSEDSIFGVYKVMMDTPKRPWDYLTSLLEECQRQLGAVFTISSRYYR
jgi:hypothetical protein